MGGQSDIHILLNALLALLLGWVVGYERYFHGSASGSQVYCLVCISSCVLTTFLGVGSNVVGSILTGIGFLGAGIIVKSGVSIRGLTTAALVWSSSAMGVTIGLGHPWAAVLLATLFVACASVIPRLEHRLPSHQALAVEIAYCVGADPDQAMIRGFLSSHGLSIHQDSVCVRFEKGRHRLEFTIVADHRQDERTLISAVSSELRRIPQLDRFSIARTTRA